MKIDIGKIDKNLVAQKSEFLSDTVFKEAREEPFRVYGLYTNEPVYTRIPDEVSKTITPGINLMSHMTTGGRVRFRTDSEYVGIRSVMPSITPVTMNGTLICKSGYDLYLNENGKSIFYNNFRPPVDMTDGYESIIKFDCKKMRDITICFPMYNEVSKLYIGLGKGAELARGGEYRHKKPIVFYGSSITQGCCASRTGNTYEAIISRRLDSDYINLGFSGGAKGEENMAKYIASLSMSVFVYDYDHNAKTEEYLESTHERMFNIIRNEQPLLPVIIVTRPDDFEKGERPRFEIIKKTYVNALKRGDKNVYFIDGATLFGDHEAEECTIDGCHPNDLGFYRMADVIGGVINKIIN